MVSGIDEGSMVLIGELREQVGMAAEQLLGGLAVGPRAGVQEGVCVAGVVSSTMGEENRGHLGAAAAAGFAVWRTTPRGSGCRVRPTLEQRLDQIQAAVELDRRVHRRNRGPALIGRAERPGRKWLARVDAGSEEEPDGLWVVHADGGSKRVQTLGARPTLEQQAERLVVAMECGVVKSCLGIGISAAVQQQLRQSRMVGKPGRGVQ